MSQISVDIKLSFSLFNKFSWPGSSFTSKFSLLVLRFYFNSVGLYFRFLLLNFEWGDLGSPRCGQFCSHQFCQHLFHSGNRGEEEGKSRVCQICFAQSWSTSLIIYLGIKTTKSAPSTSYKTKLSVNQNLSESLVF